VVTTEAALVALHAVGEVGADDRTGGCGQLDGPARWSSTPWPVHVVVDQIVTVGPQTAVAARGGVRGNCHQARLSVPLPRLGLMADSSLSVRDREFFLAEPHIAALSVSAGQGSGPLTVPIWYQYAPGGEAWVLTEAGSRKARLIETAGRFTLMVERVMPTVRYVSVEGPVTRTVPGTDELLLEIATRYLPPDKVPAYIEFATAELGEQVAIYLRPQRWLTADLGPGAVPPQPRGPGRRAG
jgi:hypothetical protein